MGMSRIFSKASALVVLIAVALVFTGLPTSVSAALGGKIVKSCCDRCNKKENQHKGTDNCSTPDCPMFLCLSMLTVTPFALPIRAESVLVPKTGKEFRLTTPAKSIFHPPVAA